jgi:ribosomal-protein-alanine N-acetyltransferase
MSTIHVRWMIRRDLPEVLDIEDASCFRPWKEENFLRELRNRNTIGMVAEENGWISGFMVYELKKGHIDVLRLAASDDRRRQGVGSALVEKLKGKLSPGRRRAIRVDLPELDASLDACRFLAKRGFRSALVRDDEEDIYRFEYIHKFAGVPS